MSGAITAGATCFYNSPTSSWTVGNVESLDPKDTFTCKSKTGPGATNGAAAETAGKLKKEDIFVITNLEILDESPDDLLMLTLLHDSTLMHALNLRYFKDVIYTYIGPIVVAFNPFKYNIPWYKDDMMPNYLAEGHTIKKNKPHSWSVAHNTFYEMLDNAQDQCVLVSGESGAGKTEAVKIVMKYLGAISCIKGTQEQKDAAQRVGHKLMQASPILEGFGNAKTVRNDNSSRFGKFMKVQFSRDGFLLGAFTIKYLLEKSRIVTAGPGERCYHSFYLLLLGKDCQKYNLDKNAKAYRSVNAGGTTTVEGVDDASDYNACLEAMNTVGITADEQTEIWKTVAGILNLLNVEFATSGEKSTYGGKDKEWIGKTVSLWQIDGATLEKELISTTREARGEMYTKELTVIQALDIRDSLVKALYDELFGWLVEKLNATAAVTADGNFIGLLDIFGFEDFQVNSFEQLCINLANETLQGHYNNYIFTKDMEECRSEGVDVTQVEFPDNTPCLALITEKMGILAMLDEECALGKGTDEGFLQKLGDQHGKHPFFEKKKLAKTSFIVKHYAGDVSYEVAGFLDKNRDTLKDDMKMLMRNSTSPFIKNLLAEPVDKAGKKITVGGFFKSQLADLMKLINSTNPHWIRCIKPHPAKKPLMWHGLSVFNQLSSSGVIGTVKVRKAGFPIRMFFMDFLKRFRLIKPGPLSDPRGTCQGIISHMKFASTVCQVGSTRVFMKTEPYVALEEAIAKAADQFIRVVQDWVRMWLAGKLSKELDFLANKEAIITQVKLTMELTVTEKKKRTELQREQEGEFASIVFPSVEVGEEIGRKEVLRLYEKALAEIAETERSEFSTIDARIQKSRRERAEREARARDFLLMDEEKLRLETMLEEDGLWKTISRQAAKEVADRTQCREDELDGRNCILDEEADDWASFLQQESESFNNWKSAEVARLASEWKNLIEGIYSVREDRKAADVANEKYKYDAKRRELTDRKRQQYVAEQLPRNHTLDERSAFDPRAKTIREHQTAKREADADVVVQKLRDRKELLVGKEVLRQQRTDQLKAEAVSDEKKRRIFGKDDNAKHDALSARHYPQQRYPLHTHSDPPPSFLFSQRQLSTVEEISLARTPRGGSSGGGTPRGAPTSAIPGSPRTPRGEHCYSVNRTRAAAGLDASGAPIIPLVPQPAPGTPRGFGNLTTLSPRTPRDRRRDYVAEEFGI
eukprot:TRINITY_DN20907_c0_g1_i1.p1 TRINITY_DN20907_c0_g1~~TRINITY_DN20907_c0_g1_i1.p1  ORF type:complete len:1208 (+),score=293.55 TRINITY_DN20907_c0_g1_i1:161-3784(+)